MRSAGRQVLTHITGLWYAVRHERMGLTEYIVTYATHLISEGGYGAVLVLMTLESMVFPVPSEAVMPFAGFLVSDGTFGFWITLIASTVGSIVGSLLSYAMGLYGGRPFVERWGAYLFLNTHHLEQTERFFARYGERAIFISRFIPVVRHLISIPAGMGKMNLVAFSLYTVAGAGLWNAILLYTGMILGDNWEALGPYLHYVDIGIIVLCVGVAVYFFVWKRRASDSPI